MKTKDGEDALDSEEEDDDEEEDYGAEGEQGEDEMEEHERIALLEEHLTDKQKAKLEAAGVTIADYLAGNGPDLSSEEEVEDEEQQDPDGDYDDEEEAEAEGDPADENGPEGVDGEKRAK